MHSHARHKRLDRQNNRRLARLLYSLMLLGLAALACNFPGLDPPDKAVQSSRSNQIALSSPEPLTSTISGSTTSLLTWEGALPGEPESCYRLEINNEDQAAYGPCASCEGCSPELTSGPFNPPQWDEIIIRFAPFEIATTDCQLAFRGQGYISGPAWERAILNWARDVSANLVTGHACSACNTVMTWSFGEYPDVPGLCAYLWVTNYGFASAGQAPCQGGQAQVIAQSWLDTEEWVQLDAWLESRSEMHLGETGASYLLGSGPQPMSTSEVDQLAGFSQRLYNRLTGE